MPSLADQVRLPGAFTADFTVVRALLARGHTYEQAVKTFEPYREVQGPDEGARDGMKEIAKQALAGKKDAYVFVNNRLEGNCAGHHRSRR